MFACVLVCVLNFNTFPFNTWAEALTVSKHVKHQDPSLHLQEGIEPDVYVLTVCDTEVQRVSQ